MNQPGWEALAHESFDGAHVHEHVRCALTAATEAHHIFGHRFPRAEALQAVGTEERAPGVLAAGVGYFAWELMLGGSTSTSSPST